MNAWISDHASEAGVFALGRISRRVSFCVMATIFLIGGISQAQTWTPLTHQPTFNASTALLLTDGTVMVNVPNAGQWWKLTPDASGSYVNGSWSQLASMPSGYTPLYFASAVLPDGRVLVEGGEYNGSNTQAETNLGAIYQPTTNSWTSIAAPSGWSNIGDAQSVVLPNGTFMLGNCCNLQQALFNASTLTWSLPTDTGKVDKNSEEGWTLLPSGEVLTVDTENGTESEIYNPTTGSWSVAGSTGNSLVASCTEIGPAVLRPNGTVFAAGGTSNTSVYNAGGASWSDGPQFPSGLGVIDGPAAILPDGNVLVMAAPNTPCSSYPAGSKFFEFNGTQLTAVPGTPNAPSDPSYVGRMLVLPTGQILLTDGTSNIQIYTASGTYQGSWQPVITSVSPTLKGGSTYTISGIQFNGLTQGAMYGDDAQSATNYPLVRITNTSTGQVYYARTHNHSTMGVATGSATVSTQFDVPISVPAGPATLSVVANGIPSSAVSVTIGSGGDVGTMTQGIYITHTRYATTYTRGFSAGYAGSYSPSTLTGGKTLTSFADFGSCSSGVCPSTNSTVVVAGFSVDPGVGWLTSATILGVTKMSSSASYYTFTSGSAVWQWSSTFGLSGSGTATGTIVHQ